MASLLERIRKLEGTAAARTDTRRSIFANVQRICAARLGDAPACPDYGLPDPLEARNSANANEYARALQHTLALYEPRFARVIVRALPNEPLAIGFEIIGYLVGRGGEMKLRSRLDAGSNLSLE